MRIPSDSWIFNTPVAHRGLWNENIPENSIPAYKNAIAHGYAIEIDVYMTTDGEIIVIHDNELTRLTGVSGVPWEMTSEQISKLRILGTNEKVPTLKEVLQVVNGQIPMLIEIKNGQPKTAVDKTVELLKNYKGEFAIQSFDPRIINRVKKLAPHFIRGILGAPDNVTGEKSRVNAFVVEHLSLNFLCKPDFISYYYEALPKIIKKAKNKAVFAWTITNKDQEKSARKLADNIIFEHYIAEK